MKKNFRRDAQRSETVPNGQWREVKENGQELTTKFVNLVAPASLCQGGFGTNPRRA